VKICPLDEWKGKFRERFLRNLKVISNQSQLDDELVVNFEGGEILIDFTGLNIYWRTLEENLHSILTGP